MTDAETEERERIGEAQGKRGQGEEDESGMEESGMGESLASTWPPSRKKGGDEALFLCVFFVPSDLCRMRRTTHTHTRVRQTRQRADRQGKGIG